MHMKAYEAEKAMHGRKEMACSERKERINDCLGSNKWGVGNITKQDRYKSLRIIDAAVAAARVREGRLPPRPQLAEPVLCV